MSTFVQHTIRRGDPSPENEQAMEVLLADLVALTERLKRREQLARIYALGIVECHRWPRHFDDKELLETYKRGQRDGLLLEVKHAQHSQP